MSSVATSGLLGPTSGLIPQVVGNNIEGENEISTHKLQKKPQDFDSETESDSSTDDEDDTSDDDKRLADNPILKERLKQLDRYATPIKHHTLSPVQIIDPHILPGVYVTNLPSDHTPNNGSLSIHGKSSGPSELMDSSLTPPEYRSRQLSLVESPTPCSGPASLNTSVTPKRNLSPPYAILCASTNVSGPTSQHEVSDISGAYPHLSSSLPCKSNEIPSSYAYGPSLNSSDIMRSNDMCFDEVEDGQACICEICHVVFANQSSLQSHMKKHIKHDTKRHQCDQCPYSTQYSKNLFKHIESTHTADNTQEFRCEGCSRCFTNENLLRDHDCILAQYNTYRCNECGRVFKTKLRLKYHADVHNPRKPYVCDIEGCDRAFRTPKYLKNHRDEFHRMHPKNYACPVGQCDLVFHRKTHLKRHIAAHDDSEKKYHCQWPNCQRRFCSEETLNLHHRKHTGEKPFNCALCLYNCYDKPSLNEHYQLHHTKDTNIVYNSEDLDHQMASSNPSQHTSEKLAYRRPFDTRTLVTRTSTPVPTLRHRMADILDSCTSQVPGPLDAEINGILDSFDKEPDLPDLFSSGPLEVDRPATELKFTNNLNQNFSGRISPLRQNSQSSCVAALPPSSSVNSTNADSGTSESSFTSVLPNILSELQRAELSGSTEEFEKVKSHVLSVLPTFVIGDELTTQINEIVDEVNDALAGQPFHVIRAAFLTTRPFTHEESYMVDLLEQQMLSESSLIAPNPPRRRGRRPKLQQQLQPYLQRIFCLESGAAESMASHLVDVSQKDKSTNHYAYYRSVGFGRSRGHRGRGRSGKHLSLTTKLLSDESVSRTNHFNRSLYHPSEINMCADGFTSKSRCGDIQGGYLTEQISSDMHPNFSSDINSQRNLTEQYHTNTELTNNLNHPNHLPTIHSHLHSDNYNYSNRRFHCPSEISPLEMGRKFRNSDDELDETQNNDTVTHTYMHSRRRSLTVHENDRMNDYAIKESHFEHSKNTRLDSSYKEREFLSQDTLGEMLEDLGVIVQQIGERAVVRKQQNYADGQPLNLSDFGNSKQGSGSTNNQPLHTKTEVGVPPIQLPSMATLASSSVSTPSIEGSTSGCISNAGLQIMSPHLSAASLHGVLSLKSHAYNQSGTLVSNAETLITGNPPAIISNASRTTEQSVYNSATNNYRRTAPVWSCESMCCSFTQENELGKADRSCSSNNFSPQVSQTRISQATGNYGNETNGDINQCFYPKDLSTRVLSFSTRPDSVCQSPISPKSFAHAEPRDRNFTYMVPESLTNHPVHLSSKTSSLGSLISATEAVDHLRSLSALGAKYTASLEPPDEKKYQSYQRLGPSNFSFSHSQIHSNSSPLHNSSEHNESVASQISRKSALIPATSALGPNIPSALNNLLYRGQKSSEYLSSVSGITSSGSNHDNSISTPTSATPTKNRSNAHNDDEFSSVVKSFDIENHVNTTAFGSLSDYSSAAAAAAAYHQLSRCANNSNNTVNRSELSVHNNYTSSSSPSMSVRSSLQELYQQQQQQLTARPPIQELTTRQLLSEAAATAYAHGLGRCDGQSSSGLSIPSIQQGSQAESLQCDNPYNTTGFSFSPNQYRYQSVHNNNQYNTQSSVSSSSRLLNEHILSNNNSASEYSHSNSKYLEHNPGGTSIRDNNYSLYPSHLPQTTPYGVHNALSRSMEEAQLNTTSQLVHSIHGVSGLAAAEAAAAAAYAYRQYHQQQTQATNRQNLIPQPPSAHTHYQNLLNQSNRSYYTGQIEENSSQRDLTLYTAHSERRDPKAAYLAETYRNAQVAPGRFFF